MLTDLPLARSTVADAALERTQEGIIETLAADPTTRALLLQRDKVAVEDNALVMVRLSDLTGIGMTPEHVFLLGRDEDGAYVAARLPEHLGEERDLDGVPIAEDAALVDRVHGVAFAHLRDTGDLLTARDAGLATTAVALGNWHQRNPRCPRCGEPTVVEAAGWVRRCVAEDVQHFPRTDPAVIMAVVDDEDRLLLGHAAHWPEGRFSTLAGYVEPGESAEMAVRREVAEEAALTVTSVEFAGSQPWPFPCSLMLGFVARVSDIGAARPDGEEITELRLFTRDELAEAVETGEVYLPMSTSIARALIEDWYGGELLG